MNEAKPSCSSHSEKSVPFLTDNQDEQFDIVNCDDHVIGRALRSEVHANSALIHRSIAVMVFNRHGQVLLQKRSKTKDTYPQYWAPSCGGHVDSGESYEAAAIREMAEELGLSIKPALLRFLFKELLHFPGETEYMSVYRFNMNANDELLVRTNHLETEAIHFLSIQNIFDFYSHCITPDLQYILNRLFSSV